MLLLRHRCLLLQVRLQKKRAWAAAAAIAAVVVAAFFSSIHLHVVTAHPP